MGELSDTAARVVELARAAGASDAFASANRNRTVDTTVRDGKLESTSDATSRGVSLRLWVDGRFSTHSTNDLRPDQLEGFVSQAVALTRLLEADPFRAIPDPKWYEGRSDADLGLADDAIGALDTAERRRLCDAQNAVVVGQERVISASSGCSDTTSEVAAVSSNGFSASERRTVLWIGTDVTLRDEGDARPEGSHGGSSRTRAGVPSPEACATVALERARARLGSTKGASRKTAMVVEAQAAGALIRHLLGAAFAANVQQGRSFFAGKIGTAVVSERLTVVDDPLVPGGLASRRFDEEGLSAKRLPIVEAGVLRNLYVDTYYGRKLGLDPTTGNPSNRLVTPGNLDLGGLTKRAGSGYLVTSWLGGNSDPTTGDFSLGLRGHVVEGGAVGAPVGEMNVTGNLLTLFGALAAVGDDPWPWAPLRCPSLLFDDVSFSGA